MAADTRKKKKRGRALRVAMMAAVAELAAAREIVLEAPAFRDRPSYTREIVLEAIGLGAMPWITAVEPELGAELMAAVDDISPGGFPATRMALKLGLGFDHLFEAMVQLYGTPPDQTDHLIHDPGEEGDNKVTDCLGASPIRHLVHDPGEEGDKKVADCLGATPVRHLVHDPGEEGDKRVNDWHGASRVRHLVRDPGEEGASPVTLSTIQAKKVIIKWPGALVPLLSVALSPIHAAPELQEDREFIHQISRHLALRHQCFRRCQSIGDSQVYLFFVFYFFYFLLSSSLENEHSLLFPASIESKR